MDEGFAKDYDVIVLGTGFIESLLAAATARIGKKVLHLDRNSYYGGEWASFSLKNMLEWAEGHSSTDDPVSSSYDGDEVPMKLALPNSAYSGVKQKWHIFDELTEGNPTSETEQKLSKKERKIWSKSEFIELNRKFNLDLAPKILFSRGPMVELLITSNVARYVEFKCITRLLTWMKKETDSGKLYVVPCSRSDVFTSDVVSLVEKNLLMKFLKFCQSFEQNKEQWEEYSNKTFREFLESHNLTENLIHFVISAIAMVEDDIPCLKGLESTALFLNSLERYGKMPFLFSLYGSGEMPQAFCRLCAVFEGTYMLRRNVESLLLNSEKKEVVGIWSEGLKLTCKQLVLNAACAPSQFLSGQTKKGSLSRAILLTDRSIYPCEKEELTVMKMPAKDGNEVAVSIVEVGSGTGVCPSNSYCVHLTCLGEDAESDFKVTLDRLFQKDGDDKKPKILYSLFFNQVHHSELSASDECPSNVSMCNGPDGSLDYDSAIEEAKNIFSKMFPGESFLPRAPDPDEIIFDNSGAESKEANDDKENQSEAN